MTSINNFSNKSPKSEKTVSHRICSKSNTTGATGGVGTAYPPGELAFISGFGGVRVPKEQSCRSRKLKKNRQHNGQKKKDKRTNNHLQNIIQKIKDRATRTPPKPEMNASSPGG
jgi:hypothetical protein